MKLISASLPAIALANQVVRFDDPKFLLTGIFETNDLNANEIFEKFMNGRWCKTLNDFSYPIENDDWTYLQDKPVEKWCKMWRLCRIETKRNEMTCNQVNYRNPKTRGLNQQKGFFAKTNMLAYSADLVNFSDPTHLQSKVLAGHVCETEYNETPCLKKTCNCDLQLADKVLDHVVGYYKQEALNNPPQIEQQPETEAQNSKEVVEPAVQVEEETTEIEEVAEVEEEQPKESNLNEKVEEIVEDHAKLVEEHTQLVEDIASFKEKVQDVVEEHAKTTMTDLKDSLAPVNESLAQEEELFEASSETVEEAVEVLSEENNTDELLSTLAETSEKAEEMGDNADTMIDDIAAFNQDFVFQDAIKK